MNNHHVVAVVHYGKKYEHALKTIAGEIKGNFGQCFTHLQAVPRQLHCALRYVKRARNSLLHTIGCDQLSNPEQFAKAVNFLEYQFTQIIPSYRPEPLTNFCT